VPTLLIQVVLSVAALGAGPATATTGDPGRGALAWTTNGCGACHALAKAGSTGGGSTLAPNLDRWLAADARRLRLPVDLFAYRRIAWGGRGMTAYGPSLGTQGVEDLVSFLVGRPFTAPAAGAGPVKALPAPPPLVTVGPAKIARWVKLERLRGRAVKGAALFAKAGCLSCHTYLGSGVRRRGAPDLSASGRTGKSVASLARYVAVGSALMPSFADLGSTAVGDLAAFLAASRGPR
jgi:cytochrome c2